MTTPALLRRPIPPNGEGLVHHVTPENAGWTYVGFDVHELPAGATLAKDTERHEVCLVLVAGKARISAAGTDFGLLGERSSVFEGLPYSV
ncbi:MAG: 5-deoxy-glucuronate isomerase, partial [Methylobacteriaceae bacterium]|nr:5-deoxy-glucuronate isomerase [Methylobacteriaceae bacterium]